MHKSGKFGKYGEHKLSPRLKQSKPKYSASLIKREERFKISPKHPGGGRK